MPVKLLTAGGGGVILNPSSSIGSDVTVNVPSVNTTMVGTDATQTLTNKTLTTPSIDSAQIATVSGTAPLYMCRAWVNFNGTGTVAIRASGNVTSITDNGTGDYTVNFTNAMPDGNYAYTLGTTTPDLSGCNVNILARGTTSSITTKTTTALRINTGPTTFNAYYDMFDINVVIHR